ncbi:hypothetical protein [Candidatus Oscillochloris fontis]
MRRWLGRWGVVPSESQPG